MAFDFKATTQPSFKYGGLPDTSQAFANLNKSLLTLREQNIEVAQRAYEQAKRQNWLTKVASIDKQEGALIDKEHTVVPAEYHPAGQLLLQDLQSGGNSFDRFFGDIMMPEQLSSLKQMLMTPRKVKLYNPDYLMQVASEGLGAGFKSAEIGMILDQAMKNGYAGEEHLRKEMAKDDQIEKLLPDVMVNRPSMGPGEAGIGMTHGRPLPLDFQDFTRGMGTDFSAQLGGQDFKALEKAWDSFHSAVAPQLSYTMGGAPMITAGNQTPNPNYQKYIDAMNAAMQDRLVGARGVGRAIHGWQATEDLMGPTMRRYLSRGLFGGGGPSGEPQSGEPKGEPKKRNLSPDAAAAIKRYSG